MNDTIPVVLELGVSRSDCLLDLRGSNRRVWVEIMLYGSNIIDQFDDRFFNTRVLENPPDAELAFLKLKAATTGDVILRELSETTSEFSPRGASALCAACLDLRKWNQGISSLM
jgi:hypothetical protein